MKLPKNFYRLLCFAISLLLLRVCYTGATSYLFLLWNLFLAWLPLYFMQRIERTKTKYSQIGLLLFVLLFLPNAPYLLTDLFHLGKNHHAPLWLDTLVLCSFALLGCVLFVKTSVRYFEVIAYYIRSSKKLYVIKIFVMLLNGYGIYLGRYLRFNSWDVILHPFTLGKAISNSLLIISHAKETIAITVCFAIFLYLILEMSADLHTNEAISKK